LFILVGIEREYIVNVGCDIMPKWVVGFCSCCYGSA